MLFKNSIETFEDAKEFIIYYLNNPDQNINDNIDNLIGMGRVIESNLSLEDKK